MSHSWRSSNSLSPMRDYRAGEWDDSNRGASWNAGNSGSDSWNELGYEHYNEASIRSETFPEFREDVGPYSREERDVYNPPPSRAYYEDGRYSPVGMNSVEQSEYYIGDQDTSDPGQYETSSTIPAITREREWHANSISRSMDPDESSWYPPDNYEEGPCIRENSSWDLEHQEDLQGWRYEEMSDTPSSAHSQSHSDSPVDGRSPESFMQHRDWSPGECEEKRASYERRPLYEERSHDGDTIVGGRKRSPPFVDSIPPHKRRRPFDSQENSIELTRDRAPVKWPNSSPCSEGGWLEPDQGQERGWGAYSRATGVDLSEERRCESSASLIGRDQRGLSPPRRVHPSMGHSYQGDIGLCQSYNTRQEDYRWEGICDDMRARVPHHRSLSPHSDKLKRAAPSRFRGSHHRSLSPRFENLEAGLSKVRAQGSDLRQLLLKRGRDRSSERSPYSGRDHGPLPRNSTSSEKELTSSTRQLSTRSRRTTSLSDDSSNSRRGRKGHLKDKEDSKQKKKEEGRDSPSPRPKSRSSDCSGSQTSRALHHKGGKDKKGETSREKGGKTGDSRVTLSQSDGKRKDSKRSTERWDSGGKREKIAGVKNVASTSKLESSVTGAAEEQGPVADVQPAIYSPIESNFENLEKERAVLRAPADDQLAVKEAALTLESKAGEESLHSVVVERVGGAVQHAHALDSVPKDPSQGVDQRVVLNLRDSEAAIHKSAVLPRGRAHACGNASGGYVIGAAAAEVQHSVEAASTDKSASETNPTNLQPSPSPVLLADTESCAVATTGTCAVSYGYTITMEKKKAAGKNTSARECDEGSRDPDVLSKGGTKTQQMASSGKDISERVVPASSAAEATAVADDLYEAGMEEDCKTTRDGNCETLINRSAGSEALTEISERRSSPKVPCGNQNQPEKPLTSRGDVTEGDSRDAVPAPDTKAALPFGYSKTWNSSGNTDKQKKIDTPEEPGNNVPTLDLTLDRIEVEPMELVDSNSDEQEELLVRGEISDFIQRPHLTTDLQETPIVGGHAMLDSSQRYSPSSPTKDCESCELEGQGHVFVPVIPQLTFQTEQRHAAAETPDDFRKGLSGFISPLAAVDEIACSSRPPETQRDSLACALEFHGRAEGETCTSSTTEGKSDEWLSNPELGANTVTFLKAKSAAAVIPNPARRVASVDGAHSRHRPRVVYVSGVKRKVGSCISLDVTNQSSEHPHEGLDVGDPGGIKDVTQGSVDNSTENKGSGRIVDSETGGIYTKGVYIDAKSARDLKGGLGSDRPNSAPPAAQGSASEQNVLGNDNKVHGTYEPCLALAEQGSFASTAGENASCMQLEEQNKNNQADNQDVQELTGKVDDRTNASVLSNKTTKDEGEGATDSDVPRAPDGLQESNPDHVEINSHTEVEKGSGCISTHAPQAADLNSSWLRDTEAEGRDVEMMGSAEADVLKRSNRNAAGIDAQEAAMQVEGSGEARFLSVGIPTSSVRASEQEYFERDVSQSLKDPGLDTVLETVSAVQTQVAKATTTTEHRSCVVHEKQVEECRDRDRASSHSSVQDAENNRLRMINLRRKKEELEEVYRRECLTFIQVAKMMVSKDPNLESQLLQSVQQNLLEMGQRCVQELEEFARLEMTKEWRHLLQPADDPSSI